MKKKRYLVTGGFGFIGKAIIKLLLSRGNKVVVIDNNFRDKNIKDFKNKNLKNYKIDIRDKNKLKKVVKNIDVVIHLAFINGTNFFYEKPDLVLDVAVRGILNILEVSKENNIKEFFLASSSEVYFYPKKIPTNEKVELVIPDVHNPRYSYAAGKIISEIILLNSSFFKRAIIFRPHNIYGPDMGYNHVIPEVIKKIYNSKNFINIQGNGKETRSFCHIEDFVSGFELLLKKGKHNNIYNIGTSKEIKIGQLVKNIIKIINKKIKIKNSKSKIGGTKRRCPDISKIKRIGYKPNISIESGLKDTVSWYLKDLAK